MQTRPGAWRRRTRTPRRAHRGALAIAALAGRRCGSTDHTLPVAVRMPCFSFIVISSARIGRAARLEQVRLPVDALRRSPRRTRSFSAVTTTGFLLVEQRGSALALRGGRRPARCGQRRWRSSDAATASRRWCRRRSLTRSSCDVRRVGARPLRSASAPFADLIHRVDARRDQAALFEAEAAAEVRLVDRCRRRQSAALSVRARAMRVRRAIRRRPRGTRRRCRRSCRSGRGRLRRRRRGCGAVIVRPELAAGGSVTLT